MDSFIFFVVTSSQCTHCRYYKSKYRLKVNRLIKKLKNVKIIEKDISVLLKNRDKYHNDLLKFIGWYPSFMLFKESSWNDHNNPLFGLVMAGILKDGKIRYDDKSEFNLDPNFIINWIKSSIIKLRNRNNSDKNLIFYKGESNIITFNERKTNIEELENKKNNKVKYSHFIIEERYD